jgi:putative PIN family toxin of toxin-antitoxin system
VVAVLVSVKPVPRLILDTNVCLDLFVFQDKRWASLIHAIESHTIEIITNPLCRSEWVRVLSYPNLSLNEEQKDFALAWFDRTISCLDYPPKNHIILPICSDKDDQKFLELSRDVNAQILITKDKALLKLHKKTSKQDLFHIQSPESWVKQHCSSSR